MTEATEAALGSDIQRIQQEFQPAQLSCATVQEALDTLQASLDELDLRMGSDPAVLNQRQTKLVGSIGGLSWRSEYMQQCVVAGIDVIRVNASHRMEGEFESLFPRMKKLLDEIEAARSRRGGPTQRVEIMGDLQGPKLRTTEARGGRVEIRPGERWELGLQVLFAHVCSLTD